MCNRHVRNRLIFTIVLAYVLSVRHVLVNALFAIWVGTWVMAKIFKYLFNSANDTANLSAHDFIPLPNDIVLNLLTSTATGKTAKQEFFILLWWACGILTAFLTYHLLKVLLISS